MKEIIDKTSKKHIRINVVDPVTITTKEHVGWTKTFTTYLINIETDHWAFSLHNSNIRRRYSEFCWLRKKLQFHHPNKNVPPLPPKRFFHINKFSDDVIAERCNGLEKFLQRVMRSYELLSDAALHLFLQSELKISEMENELSDEFTSQKTEKNSNYHSSGSYSSSNGSLSRTPESNSLSESEHDGYLSDAEDALENLEKSSSSHNSLQEDEFDIPQIN